MPACSSESASAAAIELRRTRWGPGSGSPTLKSVLTTESVGVGLDHRLHPGGVGVGLLGGDEARAHAHAIGPGGERGRDAAGGGDAARGDHRDRNRATTASRRASSVGPLLSLAASGLPRLGDHEVAAAASAARASSAFSTCQPQTAPPPCTALDKGGVRVGEEEVDVRRPRDHELERARDR